MWVMNGSHLVIEARRRAGLSQAVLASLTGTTQSAIARIESGQVAPSLQRVVQLVRACGFDVEFRVVPYEDHEWTLAQANRRLTPDDRVGKLLSVTATFPRPGGAVSER